MGANSLVRRTVKQLLHPLLNERVYGYIQARTKVRDIRSGTWSEPELDLIALAVRPGDDVLDIGANFGLYAHHLSQAVGPTGRVFAFEPIPFTSRALTLVARMLRLRNVRIVPKGCSDVSGTVIFRVPVQSSGALSGGLACINDRRDDRPGSEGQVRWNRTTEIRCEVVALDEYLPPLKDLSLVKCDIEGAELFAFRGAVKTIETHRPSVICEINPWYLEGFGLRVDDLVRFFTERGYALYKYTEEAGLRRVDAVSDVIEDNYIFIHPSRLAAFQSLLQVA